MSFRIRLLAIILTLPFAPAFAFDVTGDAGDADAAASVQTSTSPADVGNIIIEGTPTSDDAALHVDSDEDINVRGAIIIRDRDENGDPSMTPLTDAIGVKVDTALGASSPVRLHGGGSIFIDEVQGRNVDADSDSILEGSHALDGANQRIGLWVDATIMDALIGEVDSEIRVEGNGDASNIVAGILIGARLDDDLDLSTDISIFGDNAFGVDINAAIGGNYRQRGNIIDVRGENSVGIDVGGEISGSLQIEGLVNATGYSTYSILVPHGTDESALTPAINNAERRRGGSAVNIRQNVERGVIINGAVNTVLTSDERDELIDISEARTDADGNLVDVTGMKDEPYHYDANRAAGRITSHGEADGEAALKITGDLGTSGGSTRETFLDTTNDDADAADALDLYDSTQEFSYTHGLINRGTILADGLYDGFKANALFADGATIHGGIYTSGSISAQAQNADATAVHLEDVTLSDGLRSDDIVFLNEGMISAIVSTHTGADASKTASSDSAIAVRVANPFTATGTPNFVNRGMVSATSAFTTAATSDMAAQTMVGDNAIAFDFSALTSNHNLTQEMRRDDSQVIGRDEFLAGGDLDIDRSGDIGEDTNGNRINIADGRIDTRDVAAPSIVGDVRFGAGAQTFTMMAGTMAGDISFGDGADVFLLGNSMQDDANDVDDASDDYTAPTTVFLGAITNSSGNLIIRAGGQDAAVADEKTRLHFFGQEEFFVQETYTGLAVAELTLSEQADLRFTIDPNAPGFVPETDAILNVTNFTIMPLEDEVTISPFVSTLIERDSVRLRLLESSADLSGHASTIGARLSDTGRPFVYNVELGIDETTGMNDAIAADFRLKTGAELGLNPTETAALSAVFSQFRANANLETAITNITDGADFRAYYGQLLPHYGDGTMKQLASLADATTGAVAQHLQISAAGGRSDGDSWVQQFGDYRKQDSTDNNDTVSGTSYGLALGYDAPVGFLDALGLYTQMNFTSVDEKPPVLPNALSPNQNEVRTESFGVGAYLADTLGVLRYEVNASTSAVAFESMRGVNFNGVADFVTADWDGVATSASMRLAWPILKDTHLLRFEAGTDYFSLEQDDFTEQTSFVVSPGLALRVRDGNSDMTSNFIGVRGGYRSGGGDPSAVVWEPNYYVGFRSVEGYTPYSGRANFVGDDTAFDLTSAGDMEDTTEIGLGVAAHNDYFAFEFNYRGKFSEDEETHGGGVTLRLLF